MASMSKHQRYVEIKQGPVRLNRSFENEYLEIDDPYKALAAAVIFQAAVDCTNWSPDIESPCYHTGGAKGAVKFMRKGKLQEFISSDWLEWLLCWQHDISVEAVREELTRRLLHEAIST